MLACTFVQKGEIRLVDKLKPKIVDGRDAIVRVTLSSICSSDIHIKHGAVPRAREGITLGHELVGVVEAVSDKVSKFNVGDRVAVNVETFCGECFYCKNGYVNNCSAPNGGWAIGCTIDGGQAEFIRVPLADNGLSKIPQNVTDEQALFVGDILSTGYWAADISNIKETDTVLIIGGGPTGLCTLLCTMLKNPKKIIVCESDFSRRDFIKLRYSGVIVVEPENLFSVISEESSLCGADVVIECAGGENTFEYAWRCARPSGTVTIVAMYEKPQILPLPDMYGKNLTFKTGGVHANSVDKILQLISDGRLDTTPLITHKVPLSHIIEGYELFEERKDGVIKIAVYSK